MKINDHDRNGERNASDRVPSRSKVYTAAARRLLADLFVKRFVVPAKRGVSVFWIKVVAEYAMADALDAGHVWIDQASIEQAFADAGYRVRRTKTDVYVACRPAETVHAVWRFFRRGGRYLRRSRGHQ